MLDKRIARNLKGYAEQQKMPEKWSKTKLGLIATSNLGHAYDSFAARKALPFHEVRHQSTPPKCRDAYSKWRGIEPKLGAAGAMTPSAGITTILG